MQAKGRFPLDGEGGVSRRVCVQRREANAKDGIQ